MKYWISVIQGLVFHTGIILFLDYLFVLMTLNNLKVKF